MLKIQLPQADGTLAPYTLRGPGAFRPAAPGTHFTRTAYAAAHVVADARAAIDPWQQGAIDWNATLAVRQRLWRLGLGVAEAMDSAQRGMGLDAPNALQLIARSVEAARELPGARLACGCGTEALAPEDAASLDDVVRAYETQMAAIEKLGGRLILLPSPALERVARGPADHERVYDRLLSQAREPVILHGLGERFDTLLGVIQLHAAKVDGVQLPRLDRDDFLALRRRLPASVRVYTGDEFDHAELIAGDGVIFCDALLGLFDAIAPAASAALAALAAGDAARFQAILAPTVPLARHLFQAPARMHSTGLVFLAWLNGHQDHFVMLGGRQSARSMPHLVQLFTLADAAGLIEDAERAAARLKTLLALHGVNA